MGLCEWLGWTTLRKREHFVKYKKYVGKLQEAIQTAKAKEKLRHRKGWKDIEGKCEKEANAMMEKLNALDASDALEEVNTEPRVLKTFAEGDSVSVFFPTLDKRFVGIVRDKARNRTLTIEFPPYWTSPMADEPNGSVIDVPWPYENVSHMRKENLVKVWPRQLRDEYEDHKRQHKKKINDAPRVLRSLTWLDWHGKHRQRNTSFALSNKPWSTCSCVLAFTC